jgi:hypothetical protein
MWPTNNVSLFRDTCSAYVDISLLWYRLFRVYSCLKPDAVMFTGHSINWAGLLVPTGGSNSAIQCARPDTAQTVAVNSGGPREFRGGQLVRDPATGAPARHLYFLRTGPFLGQTPFILCSHVLSVSIPYSVVSNHSTFNVEYKCSFLAFVNTVMNLQFHERWSVPWRTDSLPASASTN